MSDLRNDEMRIEAARQLHKDFGRTWSATSDRYVAMTYGYIGEVSLVPQLLANCVRHAIGLRLLVTAPVYYFGVPNQLIAEKFNWTNPESYAPMAELLGDQHTAETFGELDNGT